MYYNLPLELRNALEPLGPRFLLPRAVCWTRSNTTVQTRSISSEILRYKKKRWKRAKKLSRRFCPKFLVRVWKILYMTERSTIRPCSINIAVCQSDGPNKTFWKQENVGRKEQRTNGDYTFLMTDTATAPSPTHMAQQFSHELIANFFSYSWP